MKAYRNLLTIFMASVLMIPGYRANGAIMTNEIRGLMDEKERKMQELEKCDGKRKAFMIAGISTVGLTAVGVVGNVVLANKNKKLSEEINTKQSTLDSKQGTLNNLNNEINSTLLENANIKWQPDGVIPTPVIPKPDVVINYDGYTLACGSTTTLVFKTEDVNGTAFNRLDTECKNIGGTGLKEAGKDTANGTTTYTCVDESNNQKCKEAVTPTPKKVYDNPTCQKPRVTFDNATDDADQIENIQDWCELQLQGNWTKISEQGGGVTYECKDSPVCQEMAERTSCENSGGTWNSRQKECDCDTARKSLVLRSGFKQCACRRDFVYIDDNDHSKGCRAGSTEQSVDNYMAVLNTLSNWTYNYMATPTEQLKIVVRNMPAMPTRARLDDNYNSGLRYATESQNRINKAETYYTNALNAYNALSATDKPKADKASLDTERLLLNKATTELQQLKTQLESEYNRLKTTVN